ncbi:MAG: AI-2E family transporter [Candidatus Acidiferrum sp.]
MTTGQLANDREYMNRAVEVSTHIGLVILLTAACFLIARPFLPLTAWGIIIAIAVYPRYKQLEGWLGGRDLLSAILVTLLLLAFLILPVVLLTGTVVGGIQTFGAHLKDGTPIIPPAPSSVESWPLVGIPLVKAWNQLATNAASGLKNFGPEIRAVLPKLLSASAGLGLTVLQFALSIVVAGVLLANARRASEAAHLLASRIFGDQGAEFEQLAGSTIRSVTTGILGVALLQSCLAAVGFVVARMPAAGLWTIVFLIAAVLQAGALVLIPAVIYMFAIASTTKAVIFMCWCVFVGLADNVVKPLLLGRGVAVPIIVVFLGAIGGFVAMGTIGLFVGAIILSVGYKLFLAWLDRVPTVVRES